LIHININASVYLFLISIFHQKIKQIDSGGVNRKASYFLPK